MRPQSAPLRSSPDPTLPPAPAPARSGRDVAWLLLAFGALYFFLLGRVPLANPDEGRYAQIPREMAAAGDWVMPRLNGVPYFEKPPLVYWAVGLAQKLFGYGEWSARLLPALSALGGVLLMYAAGRRIYGRGAGLAAAAVLGTSLLYFGLARVLLLDMALTVLMSATLVCFILGVREPVPAPGVEKAGARRRWFFMGLYASAALATLTKGLIGFLIPGAVMFFWLLIFNQWKRLRPLYLPSGILLFLLIAAPWHILAAQRHPGWADFYFVHEHWQRFTATGHDRVEPWWFFGLVLLWGFFPWIVFLGNAVREGVAGGWTRRDQNADAWFFITWAAFVFLFFSASQSKLIPYLLPAFPPLALLVGAWLGRRGAEGAVARLRGGLRLFAFLSGVIGIALLVLVLKPGAIRDAAQAEALRPYGFVLAALLFLGGIAAPGMARARGVVAGVGVMLAATAAFLATIVLALPALSRADTKDLAAVVRARAQPGDGIFHYWNFFHDFVYYTGRPVGLVSYTDELEVQFLDPVEKAARFIDDAELQRQWRGPRRLWVVLRKRDLDHFRAGVEKNYHLIDEGRGHYLLSNQP